MKSFLKKIFVPLAEKRIKIVSDSEIDSKKQIIRSAKALQVDFNHLLKEILFITIGVFSAGFGLKGFLLPNRFIDECPTEN